MDIRRPLRLIQFPISDAHYPVLSRPRSVGPFSATCRPPPCKKRTPREVLLPERKLRPGSAKEEAGRWVSRAKDWWGNHHPDCLFQREMMLIQETVRKADVSFRTIWKENEENQPIVHTRRLLQPKPLAKQPPLSVASCAL